MEGYPTYVLYQRSSAHIGGDAQFACKNGRGVPAPAVLRGGEWVAKSEQVDLLREGVDVWNEWRASHNPDTHKSGIGAGAWEKWRVHQPDLIPGLSEADLRGADLRDAILRGANLGGADLSDADLRGADLYYAEMDGVAVRGARFSNKTRWPYGFNPVIRGAVWESR